MAGWSPLQALTDGRWMTIRAGAATEVYDLQRDPREEHDVVGVARRASPPRWRRAPTRFTRARRRPARERSSPEAQERLRSLGYVASSAQAGAGSDAPNPAARIATWNEFEDALVGAHRPPPDALADAAALASANPDAPVIQTTYARALKDAGQIEAGAGGVSPGREALADRRDAAPRSRGRRARGGGQRRRGASAEALRDEAMRADQAALTLEPEQRARAQRRSACSRSTTGRPPMRRRRSSGPPPLDSEQRVVLGESRQRAARRSAIAPAPSRRIAARSSRRADRRRRQRPRRAAGRGEPPGGRGAVVRARDRRRARSRRGAAESRHRACSRADRPLARRRRTGRCSPPRAHHPREKDAAAKLLAALGAADEIRQGTG